LYFVAQLRAPGTGLIQNRGAKTRLHVQNLAEKLFGLLVLVWPHGDILVDMSRYSHALAAAQSRFTVEGEIPNTSAVSSMERPPKKRSSTTRLCCSSFAARLRSASSSLTRSMSSRTGSDAASSSETGSASATRLRGDAIVAVLPTRRRRMRA